MPLDDGLAPAGEQLEAVVEPVRDLGGESARLRAAASSMASGIPSSRRQIWATAGAVSSVSVKPRLDRRARSTNSCTAGAPSAPSAFTVISAGTPNGDTL